MQRKSRYYNDIIIISDDGEYDKKILSTTLDPVHRIADYLQQIMREANKRHQALSPAEKASTVTRCIMNEFALYTHDKPLSLDEYKLLVNLIGGMAKQLPVGIHLIIGTIPVLWPDQTLHNTGLHIQCGPSPLLYFIEKSRPHDGDLRYVANGLKLRFFGETYVEASIVSSVFSPDKVLADTCIQTNDLRQFGNAIKIDICGIESLMVHEICFEHALKMGIYYINNLVEQLTAHHQSVPETGSHVVMSHSITVTLADCVGKIVQADPEHIPVHQSKESWMPTLFGSKITNIYHLPPEEIGPLDLSKTYSFSTPDGDRKRTCHFAPTSSGGDGFIAFSILSKLIQSQFTTVPPIFPFKVIDGVESTDSVFADAAASRKRTGIERF